jgi:hypothetical protein
MTRWIILAAIAMASAQRVAPTPVLCSVGALRSNPEGYQYPLEDVRRFVAEAEIIVRAIALDSVAWTAPPGVRASEG